MTKIKVLGNKYGIDITRPWSNEMYEHNEKVHALMEAQISSAIKKAYEEHDGPTLAIIGTSLNGYGYGQGYGFENIAEDCKNGLEQVQNFWLHNDCWPDLLKAGLVKPIEFEMIGY